MQLIIVLTEQKAEEYIRNDVSVVHTLYHQPYHDMKLRKLAHEDSMVTSNLRVPYESSSVCPYRMLTVSGHARLSVRSNKISCVR